MGRPDRAPAYQPEQPERNQGVRKRNDAIGPEMKPHQGGFPQTVDMRHEIGGEQFLQEVDQGADQAFEGIDQGHLRLSLDGAALIGDGHQLNGKVG